MGKSQLNRIFIISAIFVLALQVQAYNTPTNAALCINRLSYFAPPIHFVNTVADYKKSVKSHQHRLELLAKAAIENFPEYFQGLQPKDSKFLLKHDRAKLGEKTPTAPEELFKFYGRNEDDLTRNEKAIFQNLKRRTNFEDREIMYESLLKEFKGIDPKGNPNERGTALLNLERIVDVVDRAKHPLTAEEMGRPNKDSALYLTDPKMLEIARFLETNYRNFTLPRLRSD